MADKEIRSINIELRASDDDKKVICGRAIPFNVFSPNREGFREMIKPEAVEGVLEFSDIFMLYNHDRSKGFLARKNNQGKGTLKCEVKEDGVYFSFEAKNDNLSQYIYERVKSGELDEMSWAFTVEKDSWEKKEDGIYERIIEKFEAIYDFSIVDNSYYGISNAVGCKRYAEIQEEDRKALEEAQKAAEEKRLAEEAEKLKQVEAYYAELHKQYDDIINKKD